MTLKAGTKLGRFDIHSQLGVGGMGEVYLALDTMLNRKVALKVLPAQVASKQERMVRFVREAKAAAELDHPNIAQVYEIGEEARIFNYATSPDGKRFALVRGSATSAVISIKDFR